MTHLKEYVLSFLWFNLNLNLASGQFYPLRENYRVVNAVHMASISTVHSLTGCILLRKSEKCCCSYVQFSVKEEKCQLVFYDSEAKIVKANDWILVEMKEKCSSNLSQMTTAKPTSEKSATTITTTTTTTTTPTKTSTTTTTLRITSTELPETTTKQPDELFIANACVETEPDKYKKYSVPFKSISIYPANPHSLNCSANLTDDDPSTICFTGENPESGSPYFKIRLPDTIFVNAVYLDAYNNAEKVDRLEVIMELNGKKIQDERSDECIRQTIRIEEIADTIIIRGYRKCENMGVEGNFECLHLATIRVYSAHYVT